MYDIIIIGGGPSGYRAAEIAGNRKMKTLLIEKNSLGGTCLHEGCIPMKSCLHVSDIKKKVDALTKRNILGNSSNLMIDLKALWQDNSKTISALKQGIVAGLKNANVEMMTGNAFIQDVQKSHVEISADGMELRGRHLIIATGSVPIQLHDQNIATSYRVITNDKLFTLDDAPKNLHIVGCSAAGLEAACFFNALGTKVTLIDTRSHVGGNIDNEISLSLQKMLEKNGIKFLLNTSLKKLGSHEIILESGNEVFELNPDCILIAIGRKPNIDGFGIENADIEYDSKGISVNDACCTRNPLIYACGDVTGKIMLAHAAYQQARIAVDNICGIKNILSCDEIPRIIYSLPQVISIGLSEEECKTRNLSYIVKSLPMTYSGKYFAENGKDFSRAKMLVNRDTGIPTLGEIIYALIDSLEM